MSDRPMARVFGYARPTAALPDPAVHADQLARGGAEDIRVERGGVQARKAMRERRRLLGQIAPGDTLILGGLDTLGSGFEDALQCFQLLIDRGVNVKVLEAGFESAGPHEEGYRALLGLLAGARSALRRETIKGNLAAAREKGGKPPGPAIVLAPDQWPEIKRKLQNGTREAVAAELGVHRQTLWAYRRRMTAQETSKG